MSVRNVNGVLEDYSRPEREGAWTSTPRAYLTWVALERCCGRERSPLPGIRLISQEVPIRL